MKPPPITIQCDCGEVGRVTYGDAWQCESCGRRWNTAQVPPGDYRQIVAALRKFRMSALSAIAVIGSVFVILALTVAGRLILLMPVALAVWAIWFWPRRRKQLREQARSLPKWTLHPE